MRVTLLAFLIIAAAPVEVELIPLIPEPTRPEASAQDYECDKPKRWDLAEGELETILARHQEWLSLPFGGRDYDDDRRANLCNADLRDDRLAKAAQQAGLSEVNLERAALNGADLRGAELNGAKLRAAELNGASLRVAKLNGANLMQAMFNCLSPGTGEERCAELSDAKFDGADLRWAKLNKADLRQATFNCLNPGTAEERCADLSWAELNGAILIGTDLNGARLWDTELNGATLVGTKLNGAYLFGAELNGARLWDTELNGATLGRAELNGVNASGLELNRADLTRAELNGAILIGTDLSGANMSGAKLNCLNPGTLEERCTYLGNAELNGANLSGAELSGVELSLADMRDVIFEPDLKKFSNRDFRQARNLHLMRFVENPDALVKLRQDFREAGRRDLERQITYAIKRSEGLIAAKKGFLGKVESSFNFVLFEVTTEWGLSPGRALIILALIVLGSSVFYVQAVYVPTTGDGGIYRLWDNDVEKRKDWVDVSGVRAVMWAFFFSLLSAFHIGFRELNIGNWIQRINPHDYSVRATGWVKTLSGIQSVLSVYLLAIWALTYFGRPFD